MGDQNQWLSQLRVTLEYDNAQMVAKLEMAEVEEKRWEVEAKARRAK